MATKLTIQQYAQVLARSRVEPRRNVKRYLHDLGVASTSEELDRVLDEAVANPQVTLEAARIERLRNAQSKAIAHCNIGQVAEMLADVRLRMDDLSLTQTDVATRCGWTQSLVSDYLTGKKEPGIGNLAKLAASVGCVWRLDADKQPTNKKT